MILNKYIVGLPTVSQDQPSFLFTSQFGTGTFSFNFWYYNDKWNCFVTTPEGEVRQIGVYPGVYNGTNYSNYYFQFDNTLNPLDIGLNDFYLGNVKLTAWVWVNG